ncbi:MAG: hypothetical protein VKS61_03010 [Candidatus Sericytochromatia bacterium]|nr:hypothetical protein [Candidatus Sericytochromatia bacterium]
MPTITNAIVANPPKPAAAARPEQPAAALPKVKAAKDTYEVGIVRANVPNQAPAKKNQGVQFLTSEQMGKVAAAALAGAAVGYSVAVVGVFYGMPLPVSMGLAALGGAITALVDPVSLFFPK